MKIPSASLEAFLAVARHGRFAKAAESLGLSQSALSQRILNLESLLEATLFVRDRSGSRLTAEGEDLLRYAKAQESLESEFLRARSGSDPLSGSLRVGAFSSVARSLVLPALAPLARAHPFRLSLLSRELGDLPDLLRRGEADFVLLDHEPAREGVDGQLLGFEDYVLARPKRAAPEIYLDHDADDTITHRYFQKHGPRGKRLERRFLDDVYGLLDGVRLGLGLAVLPLHLVREEKELEIVDEGKALKTPVWLHVPAQPWYPKLQVRALEEITAYAKKILAQR